MTSCLTPIGHSFRRFLKCEDGNSTIEALFFYIPILTFMLSGIEAGIVSTRQVMLERGLDLAVRQIRIGALKDAQGNSPDIDTIRTAICNYAAVIPNCLDDVHIKMVRMDVRNWSTDLDGPVQCINRAEESQPATVFTNGGNNELMVLQVCALFDPFFPTSGLGRTLSSELEDTPGSGFALVSTTSFVLEPFQ